MKTLFIHILSTSMITIMMKIEMEENYIETFMSPLEIVERKTREVILLEKHKRTRSKNLQVQVRILTFQRNFRRRERKMNCCMCTARNEK